MSKIICIYHGIDQDGWASAAIIRSTYPGRSLELIGYNYGMPIPDITPNYVVYICDIAFPMDKMQEIANKSKRLVWIDHHISSINKYLAFKETSEYDGSNWSVELPQGSEQISACELTWRHCNRGREIPPAIKLLGAYDVFRHKGTPEEYIVQFFQNTANECVSHPIHALTYLTMPQDEIEEWVYVGKHIQEEKNTKAKETYKKGKSVIIDGHKFILINEDRFNPINYGIDYHMDGYDGAGSYHKDKVSIWHLSLYNDNNQIDCSEICKKFGGGGHKGAAGCEPSYEMLQDILQGKYSKI